MRTLLFFAGLIALARPAVADAPVCDGIWRHVTVPGATCIDGSDTGFDYICQAGARGPLVIFFDGGGACWDGDSCDCRPCQAGDARPECAGAPVGGCVSGTYSWANATYALSGMDGKSGFRGEGTPFHGYTMFDGAYTAFGEAWNYADIAYCTGDVHSGRTAAVHTTTQNRQGYACAADADCLDPLTAAPGPAGSCQAGLCRDVTYT